MRALKRRRVIESRGVVSLDAIERRPNRLFGSERGRGVQTALAPDCSGRVLCGSGWWRNEHRAKQSGAVIERGSWTPLDTAGRRLA